MSPNISPPTPPAPRIRPVSRTNKGSRRPIFVGIVVIAALGFLIGKGLDNATMYFRTADEAVAQRSALEGKRFRLEGTVVPGSIVARGSYVDFAIASKDTKVNVRNEGQPVGVFQDNIPVVLEGKFAKGGNTFESDRVMVRHSAEYEAKYPERVDAGSPNTGRNK